MGVAGKKQTRIWSSEGARIRNEDDRQVLFPQDKLAVPLKVVWPFRLEREKGSCLSQVC